MPLTAKCDTSKNANLSDILLGKESEYVRGKCYKTTSGMVDSHSFGICYVGLQLLNFCTNDIIGFTITYDKEFTI